MLFQAARLALAPLLHAQARRVHATAVQLPEPDGPRQGEEGAGRVCLRLLVAGDSSAAGVGAPTQEQALAQPLATELAGRLRRRVRWQLIAQTGLTSEGLLQHLGRTDAEPAEIAVIVVGVNDLTREIPLASALRGRAEIVAWLRRRAGVNRVLFTSMPEMQDFPLIPQPLAWYAGVQARRNNDAQSRWAATQPLAEHVDLAGLMRPELMARDGYHPSPTLYAKVAARLADAIVRGDIAPAAPDRAANMPRTTGTPDRSLAGDD